MVLGLLEPPLPIQFIATLTDQLFIGSHHIGERTVLPKCLSVVHPHIPSCENRVWLMYPVDSATMGLFKIGLQNVKISTEAAYQQCAIAARAQAGWPHDHHDRLVIANFHDSLVRKKPTSNTPMKTQDFDGIHRFQSDLRNSLIAWARREQFPDVLWVQKPIN